MVNVVFFFVLVLNKILSSKYAWPFKTAVTEGDAPDYKTIVQVTKNFQQKKKV